MPNCDWYGAIEDHEEILSYLFQENNCDIYELSSDYEKPLKKFSDPQEIIREFERISSNGKKWNAVHLNIYVKGSGPKFQPRKIELDPKKCGGAKYRYVADGVGMVQLYLSTVAGEKLSSSHTNHSTLKRVQRLNGQSFGYDFDLIHKFSNRLLRKIKSAGYAKIGSRIVTKNAYLLWEKGYSLDTYSKGMSEIEIIIKSKAKI